MSEEKSRGEHEAEHEELPALPRHLSALIGCAEFLRENWSRLVIPSLAVTRSVTSSPTRNAADVLAWPPSSAPRSPKTSCT
ncbi:MAG TPA: hypothetical protein VMC83_41415 [Streptosporangiaceae bacterium]|nr:hypothetical protein [Streptosporangiaceae bacterium]